MLLSKSLLMQIFTLKRFFNDILNFFLFCIFLADFIFIFVFSFTHCKICKKFCFYYLFYFIIFVFSFTHCKICKNFCFYYLFYFILFCFQKMRRHWDTLKLPESNWTSFVKSHWNNAFSFREKSFGKDLLRLHVLIWDCQNKNCLLANFLLIIKTNYSS